MEDKKDRTVFSHIGKAFIIALLIVFIVRVFFVESFTISSSQMETSLVKGDKVFVDKTSYGVRMPMTILSIPFAFDSFFGFKSYSDFLTFNYRRLGDGEIRRSDIVLINNPVEIEKPVDKRSLLVSRCVALSGDTVEVKNGNLTINNVDYIFSPDLMQEYLIGSKDDSSKVDETVINQIFTDYDIPQRKYRLVENRIQVQMSRYEAFMFNQNTPDSVQAVVNKQEKLDDYAIIVPRGGMTIDLDEISLPIYSQNILSEIGSGGEIKNNQLVINGNVQTKYTFQENYLWLLSDNTNNSVDSRSIGFIPFSHIIGRVGFIWSGSPERTRDYNRFLIRGK